MHLTKSRPFGENTNSKETTEDAGYVRLDNLFRPHWNPTQTNLINIDDGSYKVHKKDQLNGLIFSMLFTFYFSFVQRIITLYKSQCLIYFSLVKMNFRISVLQIQ